MIEILGMTIKSQEQLAQEAREREKITLASQNKCLQNLLSPYQKELSDTLRLGIGSLPISL